MQENPPELASRPARLQFQSMDDFMAEHDRIDAVRLAARNASPPSNQPPTKKIKKTVDVEALVLESTALKEFEDTNWIGRLQEYRAVNPPADGLKYIDSMIGPAPGRFKCSAVLAESPQPFGDDVSFSRKKDAKQYACKKAIDWLIENKFMPADGVKFPKAKPAVPVPVAKPKGTAGSPLASASTTYAGQIPALCNLLGFTPPTYVITRVSENAALYSGYAHFNGDPRIDGKVGEVSEVYGQKNAKEMIASELFSFLKDIERQRSQPVGDLINFEEGSEDSEVPAGMVRVEA